MEACRSTITYMEVRHVCNSGPDSHLAKFRKTTCKGRASWFDKNRSKSSRFGRIARPGSVIVLGLMVCRSSIPVWRWSCLFSGCKPCGRVSATLKLHKISQQSRQIIVIPSLSSTSSIVVGILHEPDLCSARAFVRMLPGRACVWGVVDGPVDDLHLGYSCGLTVRAVLRCRGHGGGFFIQASRRHQVIKWTDGGNWENPIVPLMRILMNYDDTRSCFYFHFL